MSRCSQTVCMSLFVFFFETNSKGKAIPVQTWTGPEGSRTEKLPDFQKIATWQGSQP